MAHTSPDKYTRRLFIKLAGFSLIGFFIALWYMISSRQINLSGNNRLTKVNLSGKVDGIYFFDTFLVTKKGASLTVLTNTCTHAGCRINQEHNGELLCACHGSTYSATGKVLKGPALKPLDHLAYSTNPVTGEITVWNNKLIKTVNKDHDRE